MLRDLISFELSVESSLLFLLGTSYFLDSMRAHKLLSLVYTYTCAGILHPYSFTEAGQSYSPYVLAGQDSSSYICFLL